MDFSQTGYSLQAESSSLQNVTVGLRKVFTSDPGLTLQLFLVIPIVAAGMVLHISMLQWFLVIFSTLIFLVAGVFRTAAILQTVSDTSLSAFQVSRIRAMGNALVVIASSVSLLTYLLVFIPRIIQLL
jgi:diacylglycerol kinase